MQRIILLASALLLLAGTALFAGGGGESVAIGQSALRVAIAGEPKSVAAWHTGSWNDQIPGRSIYQGLVALDYDSMQPVGLLAESWEWNDDNTAITFNLRRGVKFHDGSDFDAADVKHSLENAANPEIGLTVHTLLRDLDHVAIVDDHTVVVHLTQPNNSFLAIIMDEAWIVPEGMLPEELKTNPIGTGPFMFEAWDRGQEIRLTKFDDYWEEGLPYLDGVVIKFIPDIDVRIAQYRQGDLDMILNVPAARVPEMRPISSIPILESDKILNTGIYFVLLNNRIAPFDNELVRQAFSYAVDRDQFIRGVAGGFSSARATLIADDSPHSISDVENDYYPQNIAKARELLAQAGYPDGIEFELMWHRTGPQWETGAQIIQASVKDAGIDITLKGEEVATLLTRLRDSRDYQAGFSATAVKPTYYHSLWDSIGRQHSHYAGIPEGHPEWWQRLQDATALEPDAFREEIADLVREHEAGQFVLTLGQLVVFDSLSKDLVGYRPHPQGAGRYNFAPIRFGG